MPLSYITSGFFKNIVIPPDYYNSFLKVDNNQQFFNPGRVRINKTHKKMKNLGINHFIPKQLKTLTLKAINVKITYIKISFLLTFKDNSHQNFIINIEFYFYEFRS